jgi:predicted permease
MLLARGMARERELNTRIFLGAGRRRMIRQLMTENLLLAALGGAAALVVGTLTSEWLLRTLGAPPNIRVSTSWRSVCAGVALALFSVLAFGLPASIGIARQSHKAGRRRQILVAVQVAVSCLLLISSAIIVRGAIRSATIDLAFDYQRMMVVDPQLYAERLTPVVARQKLDALVDRLGSLPGVDSITEAVTPPLGHRNAMRSLPGLPPVWMNPVAPSYFAALKIPVVRGRTFQPGERDAVIVSESAARAVWPNEDPLGKTWNIENAVRMVVGVVKDSGANLIADAESVEAYIPDTGVWTDRAALILHTKGDPAPLMRGIVQAGSASGEPVSAELMRSPHEQAIEGQLKMLTIIGSLSVIATALAAAGMFALVAFAVAQRTREIGIRMAIGAGPSAILKALVDQNVGPVIFGVVAGTAAGIGLGKIVRGLVFIPLNPLDWAGFASGIAAFCVIAALATLAPALKALRIDPASTLRSD